MAFSTNSNGRPKAEINVTPMIDILLVMLIIWMVIAPMKSTGFKAPVPGEGNSDSDPNAPIVLTIHEGGDVDFNQERVPAADVDTRLAQLGIVRKNATIFIKADDELSYDPVVRVIDRANGFGLKNIALMPK